MAVGWRRRRWRRRRRADGAGLDHAPVGTDDRRRRRRRRGGGGHGSATATMEPSAQVCMAGAECVVAHAEMASPVITIAASRIIRFSPSQSSAVPQIVAAACRRWCRLVRHRSSSILWFFNGRSRARGVSRRNPAVRTGGPPANPGFALRRRGLFVGGAGLGRLAPKPRAGNLEPSEGSGFSTRTNPPAHEAGGRVEAPARHSNKPGVVSRAPRGRLARAAAEAGVRS